MRYLRLAAGLLAAVSVASATVVSGNIVNLTGQPMSANRTVVRRQYPGRVPLGMILSSSAALDYSNLSGIGYARIMSFGPDNSTNGGFRFVSRRADGSAMYFPLTITPNQNTVITGFMGIGSASDPTYQLQLTLDSAAKPATSTWTVASDRRLKTNIVPFTDGLSTLNQLSPISYEYNGLGGMPIHSTGIGLIAQDVQSIIPYSVGTYQGWLHPSCAIVPRPDPCDTATTELYNLNNSALTYVLVNSVKQLELQSLQPVDAARSLVCDATTRGQSFFVQDDVLGDHVELCGKAADGTYSFQKTTQF